MRPAERDEDPLAEIAAVRSQLRSRQPESAGASHLPSTICHVLWNLDAQAVPATFDRARALLDRHIQLVYSEAARVSLRQYRLKPLFAKFPKIGKSGGEVECIGVVGWVSCSHC